MDINKIRVERLNEIIKKNGYTFAELEKLTGVSKSSWQRYAAGKTKKIPVDALEKIAKVANVEPRYLLCWEDKMVIDPAEIFLGKEKLAELFATNEKNNPPKIVREDVDELYNELMELDDIEIEQARTFLRYIRDQRNN